MISRIAYVGSLVLIAIGVFFWTLQLGDVTPLETYAAPLDDDAIAENTEQQPTATAIFEALPNPTEVTQITIGVDGGLAADAPLRRASVQAALELVTAQINEAGGLLRKKLRVVVAEPAKKDDDTASMLRKFAALQTLAVFASGDIGPTLPHLDADQRAPLLMLAPSSSSNTADDPSYLFRLAGRDEFADEFLVAEAMAMTSNVALFIEDSAWGRERKASLVAALQHEGAKPVSTQWFSAGAALHEQLDAAMAAGAGALVLAASADQASTFINTMMGTNHRLPIFAHGALAGGDFGGAHREALQEIELYFAQTEFGSSLQRKELFSEYRRLLSRDLPAAVGQDPTGFANAYDLMHLLVQAIQESHSCDAEDVRIALGNLVQHEGLIKDYESPFASDDNNALGPDDFILCRFDTKGRVRRR